jgi:hypothetical protein
MKCSRTHAKSTLSRSIFTATLLVTLIFVSRSQAICPKQSTKSAGWPRDAIVRFDVNTLPDELRTQARNALHAWNTANGRNNSAVRFAAADSTHPAVLTFKIGVPLDGGPAGTSISNQPGTSTAATAVITINVNDPKYFDPRVPGYNLAVFKVFLHEIGHTMGLADTHVPNRKAPAERCGGQRRGESVMNAFCAVNDSGDNMSAFITACDQRIVVRNTQYLRKPQDYAVKRVSR